MPISFRLLKKEIEDQGFSVARTAKGHYWLLTSDGRKLVVFAVTHGANSQSGEVLDSYVRIVRKAIQKEINE